MATATSPVQLNDKVSRYISKSQKMLINGKFVEVNEFNDWIHLLRFRFWMGHKEPEDGAPEFRMLQVLPQPTVHELAGD